MTKEKINLKLLKAYKLAYEQALVYLNTDLTEKVEIIKDTIDQSQNNFALESQENTVNLTEETNQNPNTVNLVQSQEIENIYLNAFCLLFSLTNLEEEYLPDSLGNIYSYMGVACSRSVDYSVKACNAPYTDKILLSMALLADASFTKAIELKSSLIEDQPDHIASYQNIQNIKNSHEQDLSIYESPNFQQLNEYFEQFHSSDENYSQEDDRPDTNFSAIDFDEKGFNDTNLMKIAISLGLSSITCLLIDAGIDLKAFDQDAESILIKTMQAKDFKTTEKLIDAGIDVNKPYSITFKITSEAEGEVTKTVITNTLAYALIGEEVDYKIVSKLIEKGVNVNVETYFGSGVLSTLIDRVFMNNATDKHEILLNLINKVLDAGADINTDQLFNGAKYSILRKFISNLNYSSIKINQSVIDIIRKLSSNGDKLFEQVQGEENILNDKTPFEDLINPIIVKNQSRESLIVKLYKDKVITTKHLVEFYQKNNDFPEWLLKLSDKIYGAFFTKIYLDLESSKKDEFVNKFAINPNHVMNKVIKADFKSFNNLKLVSKDFYKFAMGKAFESNAKEVVIDKTDGIFQIFPEILKEIFKFVLGTEVVCDYFFPKAITLNGGALQGFENSTKIKEQSTFAANITGECNIENNMYNS